MATYSDIEFQILEHLRALREEMAVLHVKIEGLEQRLDLMHGDRAETRPEAES